MSGEMNSQTLCGQIQNTERRAERSLDICSNSEVNPIRKEVKDKMETNMRRKVLYFFMGFVLFALLSGWAIGAEQTPKEMPKVLNLATHPIGTMLNSIGTGLGTVLSKHLPTLVKVMPTTGPTEWLPMTASGEVDMGILNNWDAKMGRLGREDYKAATAGKGAPVYLLCSGTPALNGVVVAESSGIRKGADIKGKMYVGVFTGSAGITAQARAALANWGLKPTDVRMVSVPGVEAGVRAIIEGRADVTGSTNVGMSVIAELNAGKGARYLSFDPSPEAVKRMHEHFPCYLVQVMPGPGLIGVREPVYLMGYDFYLVASEKLSNDAAYSIVKTLWENDKELGPIHVRLKDWTKDRYVTTKATIPYHPGAINYYKTVGAWGAEMDKLQKQLLEEK
jgi:TRAP transporter TAXI family solute receptor